jgi:hypothetical protein
LPRVRRKRFHVAPLSFGINSVKCQRRLARTTDAGNHRNGVVRNGNRDVLEIVDTRAANLDYFLRDIRGGEIGLCQG